MAITASVAGGNWSSTAAWVGGVVPTATDDVLLTVTSGNITIDGTTGSPSLCRDLDCTGYTGTLTHANNTAIAIYGSIKLVAGMTLTEGNSTARWIMAATTTGNTIDFGGKGPRDLYLNGAGGEWTLTAALGVAQTFRFINGTFNTANFDVSCSTFFNDASGTSVINAGSSNMYGNVDFSNPAGLTLNYGTATWGTGGTGGAGISGGGLTFYKVISTTSIGNANIIQDFICGKHSSGNRSTITLTGDITVGGNWGTSGYSGGNGNRQWIRSDNPAIQRTITLNGTASFNKNDFQNIIGAGTNGWNVPAQTTTYPCGDAGGNSGITFTPSRTLYWVHTATASLNWENDPTCWKTTSGGATAASFFPLVHDTAIFDANSFPSTGKTVTVTGDIPNMDASAATNSPTLTRLTSATDLYGDFILGASVTYTGTGTHTFRHTGTKSLTKNGAAGSSIPITMNGIGTLNITDAGTYGTMIFSTGTVNIADNLTMANGAFRGSTVNVTAGKTLTTAATWFWDTAPSIVNGGKYVAGSNFSINNTGGTYNVEEITTGTTYAHSGTANVAVSGNMSIGTSLTINAGTFAVSGNITAQSFSSSNSGVRSISLGNGTHTITGTGTVWNFGTITNLTFSAGNSNIIFTDVSATTKTFAGGGLTYYNMQVNGGASAATFTLTGTNTFNAVSLAANSNVRFPSATTTTINTPITWLGTSGNLVRAESSSGSVAATISVPSGVVNCDYINITRLTAAGSVPFYAGANSTNGGTNTNWLFTAAPATGGRPKVWNGSAWVKKPAKIWNGSAWVEKPVKIWNGSAHVAVN